jgi:hypothetical protein
VAGLGAGVVVPVLAVEAEEASGARDWEEGEARGVAPLPLVGALFCGGCCGCGCDGGGCCWLLLEEEGPALCSDQTSHRNHDRLCGLIGLD